VQQVGIVFTPGIEFAYAVCHELGSSHVVYWTGLTAVEERPIVPLDSGMCLDGTRMYGISLHLRDIWRLGRYELLRSLVVPLVRQIGERL
jgi:hypothetical protein